MSRDAMLQSIREALGRTTGQPIPDPPPARIVLPETTKTECIAHFLAALETLNAKAFDAPTLEDAIAHVAALINGRTAVASNSSLLAELGIVSMPGVVSGIHDLDVLRAECESRHFGITSADYALADTGTLVILASPEEARLISLLPPVHIALVPRERLLSGLDELFALVPQPEQRSSSMVLITGPSRTADIEQILVRGVHGPGEVHVVLV